MRALLTDTVTLLCKNGLRYNTEFSVEGLIGITVDKDEVFLVSIKEMVKNAMADSSSSSSSRRVQESLQPSSPTTASSSARLKKPRKRRMPSQANSPVRRQVSDQDIAQERDDSTYWDTCDSGTMVTSRDNDWAGGPTPAKRATVTKTEEEEVPVVIIKEESQSDNEADYGAQDSTFGSAPPGFNLSGLGDPTIGPSPVSLSAVLSSTPWASAADGGEGEGEEEGEEEGKPFPGTSGEAIDQQVCRDKFTVKKHFSQSTPLLMLILYNT